MCMKSSSHWLCSCAYISDYVSISHAHNYTVFYVDTCSHQLFVSLQLYVCVWMMVISAFYSQIQPQPMEKDSRWCWNPIRKHLNQDDILLAHPVLAPNCPWQYQMHPIECSTLVQFHWPLLQGRLRQMILQKKNRIIFKLGTLNHWILWLNLYFSSSKMRAENVTQIIQNETS